MVVLRAREIWNPSCTKWGADNSAFLTIFFSKPHHSNLKVVLGGLLPRFSLNGLNGLNDPGSYLAWGTAMAGPFASMSRNDQIAQRCWLTCAWYAPSKFSALQRCWQRPRMWMWWMQWMWWIARNRRMHNIHVTRACFDCSVNLSSRCWTQIFGNNSWETMFCLHWA